jgi:hypothetical protein
MSVASYHELARTFENELGGQPKAVRTWAVTLSDDTLQNHPTTHRDVINALSIDNYGSPHPDIANAYVGLRKVTVTERYSDSPYHVLVVAEYGVISANELLAPTSRTAEWSFESKPIQVAALYYWDGTTRRALTNSAYDYYEGLTTEELIVVAKVTKNYSDFDADNGPVHLINATNKLNSGNYLAAEGTSNVHCWKVAGVSTEYVTEIYNNVSYQYWRTTSELQYRQSTWNLFLPDVGWNFIDGGQKRRAMVFDFENGEWVASPNPVGLNGSGGMNFTATPFINERRVCEEVNFSPLFGTPPTV